MSAITRVEENIYNQKEYKYNVYPMMLMENPINNNVAKVYIKAILYAPIYTCAKSIDL